MASARSNGSQPCQSSVAEEKGGRVLHPHPRAVDTGLARAEERRPGCSWLNWWIKAVLVVDLPRDLGVRMQRRCSAAHAACCSRLWTHLEKKPPRFSPRNATSAAFGFEPGGHGPVTLECEMPGVHVGCLATHGRALCATGAVVHSGPYCWRGGQAYLLTGAYLGTVLDPWTGWKGTPQGPIRRWPWILPSAQVPRRAWKANRSVPRRGPRQYFARAADAVGCCCILIVAALPRSRRKPFFLSCWQCPPCSGPAPSAGCGVWNWHAR